MAKQNPNCDCIANAIVFYLMGANKEKASKNFGDAFPLSLMTGTREDLHLPEKKSDFFD